MSTVLDYYGQYNPQSTFNWNGLKSTKFGRTRKHFAPRDSLQFSFQMEKNNIKSGRKHYQESRSPQMTFRSTLKKINIQHQSPRISSKKIVELKLTQPFPRRQKRHLTPLELSNDKCYGIRTFYNLGLKRQIKQYSIQDRMQRKSRIDQSELRRTFFQNQSKSLMLKTDRS